MDKVEEKLSVEQGNKIIAEFMDVKKNQAGWGQLTIQGKGSMSNSELKYHSSWDWLMPVIKKLNGGRPHSAMLWEDITKALIDCDIERTWSAVVNYINWFYKK